MNKFTNGVQLRKLRAIASVLNEVIYDLEDSVDAEVKEDPTYAVMLQEEVTRIKVAYTLIDNIIPEGIENDDE